MRSLTSHEEFEGLLGRGEYVPEKLPELSIVYFTASWCNACRSLDLPLIESENDNINWLKCDVDLNPHTTGYCEVRSIPYFLAVKNKMIVGKFQSGNSIKVIEWVNNLYSK